MDTQNCTSIGTLDSECEGRVHAIEQPGPAKNWGRRWRQAARASAFGVATALSAFTATPAAAVEMYGWQFGMDVICDQTFHQVSIVPVALSLNRTPANAGYRIWYQYQNGGWQGPSDWKIFYDRTGYWDGPRLLFISPGLYQFYIEHALYTTAGWVTYGEFANHRTQIGGVTNSGGVIYCYA